jgi:uncharacterized protein
MSKVFLSAEWRKLIMANYIVDPGILKPYLPKGIELDFWEGNCFVSLVGFLFDKVKLKGIPIPFHSKFEEVNLRFYVRHFDGHKWNRGVVFISEIVPLPAISMVANWVYGEKYSTMSVGHTWEMKENTQYIQYHWGKQKNQYAIEVNAGTIPKDMIAGSKEHFIFEHYWGFTNRRTGKTGVYRVGHPSWKTYDIDGFRIHADFEDLYGPDFALLNNQQPDSVFLAEGSPVQIFNGGIL